MSTLRCILAIVAGGAVGVLAAEILLGLGPSVGAAVLCSLALLVLVADRVFRKEQSN